MSMMNNLDVIATEATETIAEYAQEANEGIQEVIHNTPVVADSVDLKAVTDPIIGLINSVLTAAIPLVAAVGALYCVLLGVRYARAEEPQDREKAKQHLKGAIIGFVLIFVLIVALRIATPILTDWMNSNS